MSSPIPDDPTEPAAIEAFCERVGVLELTAGTMGPEYSRREIRLLERSLADLSNEYVALSQGGEISADESAQLEECAAPMEGVTERTGAAAP